MRGREVLLAIAVAASASGCVPDEILYDLDVPAGSSVVIRVLDLRSGATRTFELTPDGGRLLFSFPVDSRTRLEHRIEAIRTDAPSRFLEACTEGPGVIAVPLEGTYDADRDGVRNRTRHGCASERVDCDDTDRTIFPGPRDDPSRCGRDTNCDRFATPCADRDLDGIPVCAVSAPVPPCDCDDSRRDVSPLATEICGDDVDEDCDGRAAACDLDGDGADTTTDCDDGDPTIAPGLPERCDGRDEDCDARIDEMAGCLEVDRDGDGELACEPGGAACDPNDCDAGIASTAVDRCGDGVDADGDGVDPTCDPDDADGDGFFAIAAGGSDCDDTDPWTYPFAPDFCEDGIAQNCRADQSCTRDGDGDWWIEPAACSGDARNAPGHTEHCDGRDEDCDGIVDEVLAAPEPDFPSGRRACTADPRELDLAGDLFHCGGCGRACDASADVCRDGACRCGDGPPCADGAVCCAGTCAPGPCG